MANLPDTLRIPGRNPYVPSLFPSLQPAHSISCEPAHSNSTARMRSLHVPSLSLPSSSLKHKSYAEPAATDKRTRSNTNASITELQNVITMQNKTITRLKAELAALHEAKQQEIQKWRTCEAELQKKFDRMKELHAQKAQDWHAREVQLQGEMGKMEYNLEREELIGQAGKMQSARLLTEVFEKLKVCTSCEDRAEDSGKLSAWNGDEEWEFVEELV